MDWLIPQNSLAGEVEVIGLVTIGLEGSQKTIRRMVT
jgi:hypothetical protein